MITKSRLVSCALCACMLLLALSSATAVTFTVNSNADLPDADLNNPAALASNGLTTLRAAIMQANKTPGHDIINIQAGIGDITLNRGQPDNDGQGTNDEASGDLDITGVIAFDATSPPNTTNLNNLTINGAAGGSVIQAGTFTAYPVNGGGSINTDRIFDIGQDGIFGGGFGGSTGISVTLTNLILRNGNVREALNTALGGGNFAFGGAIRYDGFGTGLPHGTLTLTNCTITNNQSDNAGGGLYHVFGTLNVGGTTFSNNITKAGEGGGLFFGAATANSNVTITNSAFTANEARQGPVFGGFTTNADGGGLRINAEPNTVTITNTNFTNNVAQEDGGAIKTLSASVTVTGGTFTGNTARRHGGAIFGDQDTAGTGRSFTISGATLRGNIANSDNTGGGDGGAIFRDRGVLNITNCIIGGTGAGEGNTATNGGGVAHGFTVDSAPGGTSNQTTVNINGGSISGNTASTDGGGVYFNAQLFDVAASTLNIGATTPTPISSNTTTTNGNGGGVYVVDGNAAISNSTISGNTAGNGGGLAQRQIGGNSPAITLRNATVSGNNARLAGGGLHLNGAAITTTHVTVANNRADSDNNASGNGGGIARVAGTTTLNNTLVGGNFRGTGSTADDVNGSVTGNNSLIGNTTGATVGGSGNVTGVDPRLGPLQNNGGVAFTHQLLGGSPALDAGSGALVGGLTTDQRGIGFARLKDAGDADTTDEADIGAYEAHPAIEDITDKTTNEDTALPGFVFTFGDTDLPISSITATSGNTTLVPNANLAISGSGASRTLNITPAANQSGTTTITVTVNGTENAFAVSSADTFVLTVNPIADTPSGTGTTTLEDIQSSSGLVLSRNTVDGAEVTHFKITGITGGTLFKSNGATQINNNDFITFAEGNAGLRFTPAANTNTPAGDTYGFTVQAALDAAGAGISPSTNVAITVSEVNDPPVAANDPQSSVLEDAGLRTISLASLTANDSRGPANESAQTLTIISVGNAVGGSVVINGANAEFTPAANFNGPASFDYTVQDNGTTAGVLDAKTDIGAVSWTVTAVNDAPSFSKGADQTVLEDAGAQTVNGWATALSAGPADEAGQALDFLVSNNNNALFSAQPAIAANGTLTFTPAASANGSATVSVQIHDNGGTANGGVNTSATQTFTINVTPVNDAPSFTKGADQTVLEDAGGQTVIGWATALSAGPADEAGQALDFLVSNNNNGLFSAQPAIAANGTLSYTPAAHANGSATVSVQIHDNGGTANGGVNTSAAQTFTINMTGVNDPPAITGQNAVSTPEDTARAIVFGDLLVTDVDHPYPTSFTLSVSNGTNYTRIGNTITPAANYNGPLTVPVSVTDPAGAASNTFNLAVTVSAQNDNPVPGPDTITRYPSQPVKVPIATLLLNDTDPELDTLTLSAVGSATPPGATVTQDGTWVYYTPPPGSTSPGVFTYTVIDGNGGTANGLVNVNIVVDNSTAQNITGIETMGDGSKKVSFAGIPGRTYRVQSTDSLGPPTWVDRATVPADALGQFQFTDPPPLPPSRFYRSVSP